MGASHPVGPAELAIVRECGRKGMGKSETMQRLGWGINSFSVKCATYPEIERAYYAGKYETLAKIRDVGVDLALEGDGPMIRFLMEKLAPEDYGKQVKVEADVKADVTTRELPIDVKSMTAEQRAHMRALMKSNEESGED